jgi:hypothetical protein
MVISRSGKSIKKSEIEKTVSELKKLPPKPKEIFGLRDAVYEMYSDIQSVLSKGYSFDEVAAFLSKGGIEIKGVTLKQYLADYRRKSKKGVGSKVKQKIEEDTSSDVKSTRVNEKTGENEKKSQEKRKISRTGVAVDSFVEMPEEL